MPRRDRTGDIVEDDTPDETWTRDTAIARIRATLAAHPITAEPETPAPNDGDDAA